VLFVAVVTFIFGFTAVGGDFQRQVAGVGDSHSNNKRNTPTASVAKN